MHRHRAAGLLYDLMGVTERESQDVGFGTRHQAHPRVWGRSGARSRFL